MSKDEIGYIVWGAFLVCLVVPELIAYFGKSFAPFPGIARTAANLEARWPVAAIVILVGLAILVVHLVFYPWPAES
jgi:hypothetical protein